MGNTVTSEIKTNKIVNNGNVEANSFGVFAVNIEETFQQNTISSSKVILVTIFYVIICFMGIVTNIITCVVIAKNSTIHSATNYYLFSLTLSDLMLLISGTFVDLPYYVQYEWSPNFSWKQNICLILPYLYRACYNISVLTVLTISVERYLAICYPFSFNSFTGTKRSIRFIFAIWIIGLISACPQLFRTIALLKFVSVSNAEIILDLTEYYNCSVDLSSNVYEDTMAITFFLIPMILIAIIYMRIGIKIRSNWKKSSLMGFDHNHNLFRHFQSRNRTMKLLFAVVVANFICWTPNQVVHVLWKHSNIHRYIYTDNGVFNLSFGISRALFNCSAFINPIIYNAMSSRFREAFSKTVHSISHKAKPKKEKVRIVAYTIIPE